jgi:hypothetical protein
MHRKVLCCRINRAEGKTGGEIAAELGVLAATTLARVRIYSAT